jgi:hypothetical protein
MEAVLSSGIIFQRVDIAGNEHEEGMHVVSRGADTHKKPVKVFLVAA